MILMSTQNGLSCKIMKTFQFTEEQVKMLCDAVGLQISLLSASEIYSLKQEIPAWKTLENYLKS